MVKRKPTRTLPEMQKELGYDGSALRLNVEDFRRFYSDFRPVGKSAFDLIMREYEAYQKARKFEYNIRSSGQRLTKTQVGFHRLAADIQYGFGLHVPFLLTENEVLCIEAIAQLQPHVRYATVSKLSRLPREIRERIYKFALHGGEWHIGDIDTFNKVTFMGGVGDPSGFYFPLSSEIDMLSVSRQMRQEVLHLAYQVTAFHLDDMDDLIKLLIAVGEMGRANITTIHFPWESRSDLECKWDENSVSDDNFLQLPALHVTTCIKLLKQCIKLRNLRIYFEGALIEGMDPKAFKTNPGIEALYSVQVDNVEIWSLSDEPLGRYPLACWLKKGMERRGGLKKSIL
ncbi:hypothetical protein BU24DRAFT_471882 [Aaosphaeria arxii CBS 175.79]|uniref:Uncharacterized protein n=1 Tax=Aaosphaeria arxii CBS 175.79 TaxID=1450172 RepID=A0A6A5XCX3_9PLEO|nr:uncharacterized protein BU24DRAFT_471882 [Aaosphaeria arxii CBS 175.79]KAF2010828.1 hypothetical protein BU24DRAFT_471882 [Aaosphaeria arxii CBS 175.79]